jgi:alpha-beta hydrolase superfamily lysophospholipase
VIKETNFCDALEVLLSHLENLVTNVDAVKKSWTSCPSDQIVSASTVIYSSTRVKSMDLIEIRRLLTLKYGQKWALACHQNTNDKVDKRFIVKVETSVFPSNLIFDVMTMVAREYRIKYGDYDPSKEPPEKIEITLEPIKESPPIQPIELKSNNSSRNNSKNEETTSTKSSRNNSKNEDPKSTPSSRNNSKNEDPKSTPSSRGNSRNEDKDSDMFKRETVERPKSSNNVLDPTHHETHFFSKRREKIYVQYWIPLEDVDYTPNLFATVLYDFEPEGEGEIAVKEGDVVHVIHEEVDPGWTSCRLNATTGVIPTTFLKMIDRKEKKATNPRKVRGKVIIQHTLHDHSGRYQHFAKELVNQGFAVFAMDMAGHGRSEGLKGYINSFADLIDDFSAFYDIVNDTIQGDVFIFGQGFGGNVALLYYMYHAPALKIAGGFPKGMILSGCVFDFTAHFKKELQVGAKIAKLTPQVATVAYDLNQFTVDKGDMKEDSLCIKEKIKAKTASQLIYLVEKVQEVLKDILVPFYILQGENDPFADPDMALKAYDSINTPEKFKNINVIRELKHDLLHEACYEALYEEIVEFIKKVQANY